MREPSPTLVPFNNDAERGIPEPSRTNGFQHDLPALKIFSAICYQARAVIYLVCLIIGTIITIGICAWGVHNRDAELKTEFEYQTLLVAEAQLYNDCVGERAARLRLARVKADMQYLRIAFPSRFFVEN